MLLPEICLYVYVKNLTDPTVLPSRLRNQISFRFSENIHPARGTTIVAPSLNPNDSHLSPSRPTRTFDSSSTVTERCILLMKGRPDRKVIGAIVIKGLLAMKPKEKKVLSLEVCTGETKVEFFGKLIEDLCELLVAYRELPFIRDIGILKKKQKKPEFDVQTLVDEEAKGNPLKEEKQEVESQRESHNGSNGQQRKLEELKVSHIAELIDEFFANNSTKVSIGFGEVGISLFENTVAANKVVVNAEPFVKFKFPAANMSFAQEDGNLTADVFGITFECTKRISFLSHFVKELKSIFVALSGNEAILEYVQYYNRLLGNLEKKREFKFDRFKALRLHDPASKYMPEESYRESNYDNMEQASSERESKSQDNRLSKIILKQEYKTRLRKGLGSDNNGPTPYGVDPI